MVSNHIINAESKTEDRMRQKTGHTLNFLEDKWGQLTRNNFEGSLKNKEMTAIPTDLYVFLIEELTAHILAEKIEWADEWANKPVQKMGEKGPKKYRKRGTFK